MKNKNRFPFFTFTHFYPYHCRNYDFKLPKWKCKNNKQTNNNNENMKPLVWTREKAPGMDKRKTKLWAREIKPLVWTREIKPLVWAREKGPGMGKRN